MNIVRSFLSLLFVAAVGLLSLGCDEKPKPLLAASVIKTTQVAKPEEGDKFDLSVARTIGNGTWIPINRRYLQISSTMESDPENPGYYKISEPVNGHMPFVILEVIAAFEQAHPELEVYERHIEGQQDSRGSISYCFGIYLFHRHRR